MKVSKERAQENRARVVEAASVLFRERGYDGIGVAELMAAAGLTHGGFYNQFQSKAALMAESAGCGLMNASENMAGVDACQFIEHYLSRQHRDARGAGCTLAALGGDAARQDEAIKAEFQAGIETWVQRLGAKFAAEGRTFDRAQTLSLLAHVVGAIVLSRACPDDSALADEVLEACREQLLASLQGDLAAKL